MPENVHFWNWIARRYARTPIADEASYAHKLKVTAEYLAPDAEVFEFGCGTGSTAVHHAPNVAHYTAIDVSPKMIEIAEGKRNAAGLDTLDFQVGRIETFQAPPGSFDAVLGMSILHLLRDRQSVLSRVHRLLRPGGVFVSSTACIGGGGLMVAGLKVGNALGVLPLVRSFSADALRTEIRDAGFAIEVDWQPAPDRALFLVARKPGSEDAASAVS